MKRKQLCSIITAALMATTLVMPYNAKQVNAKDETSVSASSIDNNAVDLQFQSTGDSSNGIQGKIILTNNTGADLDLSSVPIKYYYTNDYGKAQEINCDYCGVSKGMYQGFTDKVKATVSALPQSEVTATKDTVADISFASGTIAAGDVVEICIRIHSVDWSSYDKTNDYGLETNVVKTPSVNPEKFEIEQGNAADTKVSVDYKGTGDSLESIMNGSTALSKDTDYTVDGSGNVVLKDSFLNSLNKETQLTYNFTGENGASSKTQTITVKSVQPTVTPETNDFYMTSPKDVNTTIGNIKNLTLTKVTNGNTELTKGTDYTVTNNTNVTISKDYLGTLPAGPVKLTYWFSNGAKCDVTIKVIPETVLLDVELGSVKECKHNDEIEVPVMLNSIPKYGLSDYDFTFNYDSTKLKFEGVEAADLTEGFQDSFQVKDDQKGSARIDYLIESDEEQTITKTGTLCILKFKVVADPEEDAETTTVSVKKGSDKFTYFDEKAGAIKTYTTEVTNANVTVMPVGLTMVKVGNVDAKPGEVVKVPVTLDQLKAVLGDFSFNVSYDAANLELTGVEAAGLTNGFDDAFEMKDAQAGSARINYLIESDEEQDITSDGVLCNLVFKVKANATEGKTEVKATNPTFTSFNETTGTIEKLKVKAQSGSVNIINKDKVTVDIADNVEAAAGAEVEVPVNISNIKEGMALGDYQLVVNYDASKLEYAGVAATGLSADFDASFDEKDKTEGSVRINYLIENDDEQDITSDGVLFNLKFKVKDSAKVGDIAEISAQNPIFTNFNAETGALETQPVNVLSGSVKVVTGGEQKEFRPAVELENSTFDNNAPADIVADINADGGKFEGIAGLTKDEDYTVSGNKVTIKESYLEKLTADKKLAFNFSRDGQSATVTAKVTVIPAIAKDKVTVDIADNVEAAAGAEVEVPVNIANVKEGMALGDYQLVVNYDASKLEYEGVVAAGLSADFEDSFDEKDKTEGSVRINYLISDDDAQDITSDGVLFNLKFKVKDSAKVGDVAEISAQNPIFTNFNGETGALETQVVNLLSGSVKVVKGEVQNEFKPTVKLENSTFDNNDAADIVADINADGGEFAGIDGLSKDKDYTVSGDKVTINKSYLETLTADKELTFNFTKDGQSESATVKVAVVKEKQPAVKLEASTFDKANEADVVADLTKNGWTFDGVKELASSDYTVSGDKVTLNKAGLDKLEAGNHDFTFKFVKNNKVAEVTVTITVKDKVAAKLGLSTPDVTATAGSTVDIPIYIHIDADKQESGLGFDYADSTGMTYSKFVKGPELLAISNTTIDFNYKKATKKGSSYALFPKASSGVVVTGDYLYGTLKVTVDASVESGTEIPVNITNVQFSDKNFKPDADTVNVSLGKIIVK